MGFKFIDLFSGIGGFHQALKQLNGECVFASEIDPYCINVYKENYLTDANYDITKVKEEDIPKHDVLCAGFPCQAFSKAGSQNGFLDTRGTLFFEIERILKYHKTKFIILENVRNLVSHDKGKTWKVIQKSLRNIGYRLTSRPLILSPHQFGIPQLRERVIILGIYDPINRDKPLDIKFDNLKKKSDNSIYTIVEPREIKDYEISPYEVKVLEVWDEFYQNIKEKIIGFPIWTEFFNKKIREDDYPKWKVDFINKNKELYNTYKDFIDEWLKKHDYLNHFVPTHKKFEWQAGDKIDTLWDGLIQFRPSGIRVKATDNFPALVAMVQIPIIGRYRRRLTVDEARKIQSFPAEFRPDTNINQAYKQFGNAVNVEIIKNCAIKLFNYKDLWT